MDRHRVVGVGVGALIVAALVIWAWPYLPDVSTHDDGPRGGATEPPSAPPASVPQAPPVAKPEEPAAGGVLADFRGTVKARDGSALAWARVYLLRKGDPGKGASGEDVSNSLRATFTDPGGRWSLGELSHVRGYWIGAAIAGYIPEFVDGDAIKDLSAEVAIILDPAPERTLTVLDPDGKPVSDVTVHVSFAAGGRARQCPAPGEPALSSDEEVKTDAQGVARFHPSPGSEMEVSVSHPSFVTEEGATPWRQDAGNVAIAVQPACKIDVHATEAETGAPVPKHELIVNDENGGLTTGPFRPGTYRVQVLAEGRIPWRSPPITFRSLGEHVVVEARLEPDMTLGQVVVEVEFSAAAYPTASIGDVMVRMRRRSDGPAGGWSVTSGSPEPERPTRPPESPAPGSPAALEIALHYCPTATYDILAWDTKSRATGVITGAVVVGGTLNRFRVRLGSGLSFRLDDVLKDGESPMDLRIGSATVPALPLMDLGKDYFSWAWKTLLANRKEAVLGPYPFDALTVTVVAADGETRKVAVNK